MLETPPIFIVGHERSGTTLLELMLRNHPAIDIPPESDVFGHLLRREASGALAGPDGPRRVVEGMFRHRWLGEYWHDERGLEKDDIVAAALRGEPTAAGIFRALMSWWAELAGATRWGEKAPRNYRYLRPIAERFPDARVLHIVRDPRDVAVSMLTGPMAARHDHGNVYEVCLRWRDSVRKGDEADLRLGEQGHLRFRYEDLVDDPEVMLRRICAFLEEDFDPAMLDYHRRVDETMPTSAMDIHQRLKQKPNKKRVGRWKDELPREMVLAIEALCGPEMAAHGYEPSGLAPGAGLRLRAAFENLRPRRLDKRWKPLFGKRSG